MTATSARRRLPWTVPVLVAVLVGATATIAAANSSDATPSLPSKSVSQLLVAVQKSTTTALSGQVHENLDLGLPSLPGDQSGASLSLQSLLVGPHTARVWVDGPDKQRLALLGELSEADAVHNGRDVWTYTSDTNSVSHTVLPTETAGRHAHLPADYSPSAVAGDVLAAVAPSTQVTVGTARTVADRAAYTLVIKPRDHRSTVSEVRISIDARRYVPLDVAVFAGGSAPAFETGFTQISFARPAASIFDFTPPAGASVSTNPLDSNGPDGVGVQAPAPMPRRYADYSPSIAAPPEAAPRIVGSGWTTVVEVSGPQADGLLNGALGRLTTSVGSSGARLLHTALLNAVLLPDGRAFLGAVQPAALEAIAQHTSR